MGTHARQYRPPGRGTVPRLLGHLAAAHAPVSVELPRRERADEGPRCGCAALLAWKGSPPPPSLGAQSSALPAGAACLRKGYAPVSQDLRLDSGEGRALVGPAESCGCARLAVAQVLAHAGGKGGAARSALETHRAIGRRRTTVQTKP